MRNTFKKIMTAVLAVALLLGVLAVPPQDAQAAGKSYMKGLKLNWDLKKNKAMKYTTSAEVFKKVSGKAKITNYKVKSAGKGYKQLSFNVTFRDDKIKISNAQWKELRRMNRGLKYGTYWISVADYDTGLSLERKNKFGVKVRSSRWKTINAHTYRNGNDTFYVDGARSKVTITYPEDYDGLCIGVGGQNRIGDTRADSSYWSGKTKFGKTSFYKTGKKNSHWMRIRASKKKPTASSKPQVAKTPVPTSSPSGGIPATSVPVSTPSGNTPATSVPVSTPSGNTPATSAPASTPSGDAPAPTISPDVSGLRTMVYDGTNSEEINSVDEPIAVVVKDGITDIGDYTFGSNLRRITISDSVTNIESFAFESCSDLEAIQVSTGNTVYDSRDNCNAIINKATNTLIAGCKNTNIPDSVTSIGCYAFHMCDGLTSLTIPNSVTEIGGQAFNECNSLTSLTIPNSVTEIGSQAFSGCSSLTSLIIPDGVTVIDDEVFAGCSSLTSLVLPDGVTDIGVGAFFGCDSLTSLKIPDSVTDIWVYAFAGYDPMSIIWKGNVYDSVDSFMTAFGSYSYDY